MRRMIDADGHVVEPPMVWREYAEPAFRESFNHRRLNDASCEPFWRPGAPAARGPAVGAGRRPKRLSMALDRRFSR